MTLLPILRLMAMTLACLLLLLLLVSGTSDAQQLAVHTVYSCEGESLSLLCQPGASISVVRANFGRFSVSVCNPQGRTNISTHCSSSPSTSLRIHTMCGGLRSCRIKADSIIFEDNCPRTNKYLEVQYNCLREDNANSKHDPPVHFTPPSWEAPEQQHVEPITTSSRPPPVFSDEQIRQVWEPAPASIRHLPFNIDAQALLNGFNSSEESLGEGPPHIDGAKFEGKNVTSNDTSLKSTETVSLNTSLNATKDTLNSQSSPLNHTDDREESVHEILSTASSSQLHDESIDDGNSTVADGASQGLLVIEPVAAGNSTKASRPQGSYYWKQITIIVSVVCTCLACTVIIVIIVRSCKVKEKALKTDLNVSSSSTSDPVSMRSSSSSSLSLPTAAGSQSLSRWLAESAHNFVHSSTSPATTTTTMFMAQDGSHNNSSCLHQADMTVSYSPPLQVSHKPAGHHQATGLPVSSLTTSSPVHVTGFRPVYTEFDRTIGDRSSEALRQRSVDSGVVDRPPTAHSMGSAVLYGPAGWERQSLAEIRSADHHPADCRQSEVSPCRCPSCPRHSIGPNDVSHYPTMEAAHVAEFRVSPPDYPDSLHQNHRTVEAANTFMYNLPQSPISYLSTSAPIGENLRVTSEPQHVAIAHPTRSSSSEMIISEERLISRRGNFAADSPMHPESRKACYSPMGSEISRQTPKDNTLGQFENVKGSDTRLIVSNQITTRHYVSPIL